MTTLSIKLPCSIALCVFAISMPPSLASTEDSLQNYLSLATSLCQQPDTVPPQLEGHQYSEDEIVMRQSRVGREKLFSSPDGSVKLEIIEPAGRAPRTAMTCLLYTSPSPRDKRQSRMPSSA